MKSDNNIFILKSKKNNYCAYLEIEEDHFVLKSGSTVSRTVSKHFKSYKTVLERRTTAGIIGDNIKTNEDINFKSSSIAGEFVCGSSCNGPSSWKLEDGTTLKQWLEENYVKTNS